MQTLAPTIVPDTPKMPPELSSAEGLSIAGRPLADLACNELRHPFVSFVVVCWNYAGYVAQAIRSIKNQDYPYFECLVIDNGSDDGSGIVIQSAIEGDSRFRMERLESNMGQLGAEFWALDHIRGGFVVFVDADDLLFSNFASSHVQTHLALPKSVALTSSSATEMDAEGKILTSRYSHIKVDQKFVERGICSPKNVVRLPTISDEQYELIASVTGTIPREIGSWHWGPGTSNMYRKSMLDLVRLGDGMQTYMRSGDTHFNYMCHAIAGSAVIDLPLSAYRVHGTNYFARQETLDPLSKGTKEYADKSRLDRLHSAEIILKDAQKFSWLLGGSYWRIFDQCAGAGVDGSRRIFRRPEAYELFVRNLEPLALAHEKSKLGRELARRFGRRRGGKLMSLALKRRLPMKMRGQLLLLSLAGGAREIFRPLRLTRRRR